MIVVDLSTMTHGSSLPEETPTVLCLGNFDGVHIGHRQLISKTIRKKNALAERMPQIRSGVWCFAEYPASFSRNLCLTTTEEKLSLFAMCGLDYAILEDFSSLKDLSPDAFVQEVLRERCHCRFAVCGFNYRFGKDAAGTPELLSSLMKGALLVVPEVHAGETRLSSTVIRSALLAGEMEEATALLGHPYFLRAPVEHGKRIGHKIGVPTLNQSFPAGKLVPRHGIYVSGVRFGQTLYPAVTNIGTKPTVNSLPVVNCETHIIGFDRELYGEIITVELLKFLREEKKFGELGALRRQIAEDIQNAARYHQAHRQN